MRTWCHDEFARPARRRRTNQLIAALGLEFLGMMLFRANGFIIVVLAAAALVCLLPGLRARLAAVSMAAILLSFFLNYVVYPAAGIKNASASRPSGQPTLTSPSPTPSGHQALPRPTKA